ncbi:hypothetical protein FZ025_00640 [Xanthomonas hyacinthi]|uniref:Uncharacterized protein n=1 Tax=Xanthomonas hyacinthi TaxID=56455 RepID=A0A2S7ENE7_9XANT|nr:hypothetical protein [Xanthomonas hyacinthi]KLD73915.1 hypothetical protein Y886_35370 [Xanthomonas hyacinthi DSM 19077]PPU92845.1 hypothetical protein XhyaCFBP1156_20955 [Xanthomonas hyacinthi]QGY75249.1 hypothetical protein FZ025_00640 [Xanthomonas hyacinthi]
MKTLAAWLYESFPVFQEWFPIPALFLIALYALVALIGLAIAAWLFWKWFNSGLDGIPDPVYPVIQRVVVVHEHRHSRDE